MEVPASALRRALGLELAQPVRQAFEHLVACRHLQVEHGMPLQILDIGAPRDDICARAIALQAELICLDEGELWFPLPDDDPCGRHFVVIGRGRGALKIAVPQLRIGQVSVMPIENGTLLLEGLVAKYGAHIQAATACELYRVRESDYLASVSIVPSLKEWPSRYQMLEARTQQLITSRGNAARGIISGLMPHPNDEEIQNWGDRRQKAIRNARSTSGPDLLSTFSSGFSVGPSPSQMRRSTMDWSNFSLTRNSWMD